MYERAPGFKGSLKAIVTTGDLLSKDTSEFMRGHGTYVDGNGTIRAAVSGLLAKVNRLIQVNPGISIYNAEVGDVVVGRISFVEQKRWKVDIGASLDAFLPFSCVNLPGGEVRRRGGDEEEKLMRKYLTEGDLVSAEVYGTNSDGSLILHTRSMKYGKLGQGVLVNVPNCIVCRTKTHFVSLPCGASLILGMNGKLWVTPSAVGSDDPSGGFVQNLEPVALEHRDVVSRIVSCIKLLSKNEVALFDTTIMRAYNASLDFKTTELNCSPASEHIINAVRYSLDDPVYD